MRRLRRPHRPRPSSIPATAGSSSGPPAVTSPASSSTHPWLTGYTEIPSYAGYDRAGEALAGHGYIVVSIGADAIKSNDNQLAPEDGAVARGQLVLDTLSWLKKADEGRPVSFYDAASDKTRDLDQALAGTAYRLHAGDASGCHHDHVAAVLRRRCADDWRSAADPVCGTAAPTTTRRTATQQFQVGSAYIARFFGLTLGGAAQFQAMFDGSSAEPVSMSPARASSAAPT